MTGAQHEPSDSARDAADPAISKGDSAIARARRFVLAMGIVAMLGDLTYEGARSISGPYLALLGASATAVGAIAGAGELAGYALRVVSGWLADRTRAHWPMVALGYGINLVAVPGLALTGRWEHAAVLVVLERIGKALRSPSKSALMATAGAHIGHGKAFGLEEALDQIGAVGGPLIVAGVMALRAGDPADASRAAFAALAIPVLGTLAVLRFANRRLALPEPAEHASTKPAAREGLGARFEWTLAAIGMVGFGFPDWAIVAVHAGREGLLGPGSLPIAYAVVMGVDGAAALAFGSLFDRIGLRALALGCALGAIAPFLSFSDSMVPFVVGSLLWAIALGALESISKAAIAASVSPGSRGRAYGLFFGVFGVAWWLGSTALGALYDASPMWAAAVSTGAQALGAITLLVIARTRG